MSPADEALLARLDEIIAESESACVAFSGGVDSSLLLWVAVRTLGAGRVVAFTAASETYLPEELEAAQGVARGLGVEHVVAETDELSDPGFAANPRERCYACKGHLLEAMRAVAAERGCAALLDGANLDDLGDHRPGMRAAAENGVRHPLLEAGVDKAAVRRLARAAGLPTWDAPQQACLASRIPYGEPITVDKLEAVAEAERALHALGFRQCRVRHHGSIARVEVEPAEIERAAGAAREEIARRLRALGFTVRGARLGWFPLGKHERGVIPLPSLGASARDEQDEHRERWLP